MEFARPGAAFLLLLLPALVWLHTRGGRRAARVVPSLALWHDVPEDTRGAAAARRPPLTLSLVLQTAALLAATAALMAPGSSASGAARRIVVVVDVSASMAATDVAPSRLAAATEAARSLLDSAPRGARAALILAAHEPHLAVGFTRDLSQLRAALPHSATDAGADLDAAASLALAVAGGAGAQVHLYTDGDTPGLDDRVHVRRFGGSASNVALSDLTVAASGVDVLAARLRVSNYGDAVARVPVLLTPSAGAPLAKAVSVPPGSHVDMTFDGLAPSVHDVALTARATFEDDLDRDNYAYAVLPARRPMEVVVVGDRSGPLATLLALDPLADVVSVPTAEYLPRDGVALTVFHGWAPHELPPGDVVILDPQRSSPYAPSSSAVHTRFVGAETHALLRLVDLAGVTARAVGVYSPEHPLLAGGGGSAEGIMRTPLGPAAVSVADDGRGILVLGYDPFDLSASDMSLQPALVVLFANVVEAARMRTRAMPVSVVAGAPGSDTLRPHAMAGRRAADTRDGVASGLRAGIYTAEMSGRRELVAANVPPGESDLRRQADAVAPPTEYSAGGADSHWRWYALAAVCLLSAEWATHHRRRAAG